jgi:YVTN family beta-propeller protein
MLGRIDTTSDRMASTAPVGLVPRFAVAAFGSVWVSNYLDGTVSRVDPATGNVTATVETKAGPQIMVGTTEGVWVSATDDDVVQRIDPEAGAVVQTLSEVGPAPDGLTVADGAVWVASNAGPALRRIDPATGQVAGPIRVAAQGAIPANQLVAAAGGRLWLPIFERASVAAVRVRVS